MSVRPAAELGDPAWIGAADFIYTFALPVEAAAAALKVGERSLIALQGSAADPNARQMHSGRRDKEALIALARAERAAPTAFRLSPITRDLVSTMVTRARRKAVAEDLLAMARRLGIGPT